MNEEAKREKGKYTKKVIKLGLLLIFALGIVAVAIFEFIMWMGFLLEMDFRVAAYSATTIYLGVSLHRIVNRLFETVKIVKKRRAEKIASELRVDTNDSAGSEDV